MDRATALAPFHSSPATALVAVDFDGTLSPIVDDPASARPVDGIPEVLEELAGRMGEVAVVSGRPLAFLEQWFPHGSRVGLYGLYGLEARRRGERVDHPSSGVWRETIADVAARAVRTGPEGMEVESKGLSITLHYRQHPEVADAVEAWARGAAAPSGLRCRPAKMSVELHPPIDEDKGTVLVRLADEVGGPVFFGGDDVGDLPAFEALDRLAAAGRPVLRVAVDGPEAPLALTERADLLVDDPHGMADLLGDLLD